MKKETVFAFLAGVLLTVCLGAASGRGQIGRFQAGGDFIIDTTDATIYATKNPKTGKWQAVEMYVDTVPVGY